MGVPNLPAVQNGFIALWPGMEPDAENFVYQNVVDNDQPGGTNGQWGYVTWALEQTFIVTPNVNGEFYFFLLF
jgi:hypothetical protein